MKQMGKEESHKEGNWLWAVLVAVSVLYVIFFASLHFIYDWDTISRAIWIQHGDFGKDTGVTHFMVSFMAAALVHAGIDPLNSFRVLTAIFMLTVVLGCGRLVLSQTGDELLAVLSSLFIIFNFGFTFLLTTLEDNIWMYAPLTLFAYFLLKDRIVLSSLFLSLAMLVHIQSEVFIPMLVLYVLMREDLFTHLMRWGRLDAQEDMHGNMILVFRKYLFAMFAFLFPLSIAYSYLVVCRGWRLQYFIQNFLAAGPAYHGDREIWFFASNNTLDKQLHLAASGFVSTFVCRYPDYLKSMPRAEIFGGVLAIIIVYILAWCIVRDRKVLCAIPTFLVLFFHALVFESWSIERWDFLPFFIVYFLAAGYSSNEEDVKRQLKWVMALAVVLCIMFTFASFNALCGLREGSICAYGDHLSEILENNSSSMAIELSLKPRSTQEFYLTYMCGDRISFNKNGDYIIRNLTKRNIYTSSATYQTLPRILPKNPLDQRLVWSNPSDASYSIVLLTPRKANASAT